MKIYTEKGFKQWEKTVVNKYFMLKTDIVSGLAIEAGFAILECGEGKLHKPEDGVILHCAARR